MALGSTQPPTDMRIKWGKCDRCVRLTTLPPPCVVVMKSGNFNFLEPSGPLQASNRTDFYCEGYHLLGCHVMLSVGYQCSRGTCCLFCPRDVFVKAVVASYQIIWYYIPEDSNLHYHIFWFGSL